MNYQLQLYSGRNSYDGEHHKTIITGGDSLGTKTESHEATIASPDRVFVLPL
jgi:hypothetical protein